MYIHTQEIQSRSHRKLSTNAKSKLAQQTLIESSIKEESVCLIYPGGGKGKQRDMVKRERSESLERES